MIVTTYPGDRPVRIRLDTADIEEAVARLGWSILHGTTRTPEEQAEIDRIEAKGYAEMATTTNDASTWWKARVVAGIGQ